MPRMDRDRVPVPSPVLGVEFHDALVLQHRKQERRRINRSSVVKRCEHETRQALERSHQALGMKYPAELYEASPRRIRAWTNFNTRSMTIPLRSRAAAAFA